MRYLLLAVLCLISSVAGAQVSEYERKFTCGKTKFVLETLTKAAKEKPIWSGKDDETETDTVVMVNPTTLTWTIVQYDRDMACVLHSGEGFKFRANVLEE
jgi:hypothetical protein